MTNKLNVYLELLKTEELNVYLELPNRKGVFHQYLKYYFLCEFTNAVQSNMFVENCGVIGIHQATARRTITRVTEALLPLASDWIRFATRRGEQEQRDVLPEGGVPECVRVYRWNPNPNSVTWNRPQ